MKIKSILISFAVGFLALAASSCDNVIYDGEGDCDVLVCFAYDYNMKYADAFPNEVSSVALYIFDQQGNFLTKATDAGEHLAKRGYVLPIKGIKEGVYDVVAWCGLIPSGSFTVDDPVDKDNLLCRMGLRTKADQYIETDLDPVYYGYLEDVHLRPSTALDDETPRMYLCKNTNNIRVMLQALNPDLQLKVDEYDFVITDCNANLDWTNNIVDAAPIDYIAWNKQQGYVEYNNGAGRLTAAIAEFTTNRLFKRTEDKMMLNITDKVTGKMVISIPVVDYFLMVKGLYNEKMTDQEYLDRQDEYQITFFLDNARSWLVSAGIYINGWHVVTQNSDLDV